MSRIIGSFPVNPHLFITGKISTYTTWIVLIVLIIRKPDLISLFLFVTGFKIIFVSMLNLGNSNSLGLPHENTKFKRRGLYRFSRNPMYLGFFLLIIGAIYISRSFFVFSLGIYGIYTHHKIILSEEKFLFRRFGKEYDKYHNKVPRYL